MINEDIDAREAYTRDGSINTIINNKRDVGFIINYHKYLDLFKENNIKYFPIKQKYHNLNAAIIYKDNILSKSNALKLVDYLNNHDGYLNDNNSEDARYIGRLLGYTEDSINDYINTTYNNADTLNEDLSLNILNNRRNNEYNAWITPDNKVIFVEQHIDFLRQNYKKYYNLSQYEDDDDSLSSIDTDNYIRAFREGYIRIRYGENFNKKSLNIEGYIIEKIKNIINKYYFQYLTHVNSEIYIDSSFDVYSFNLPKDTSKLEEFLNSTSNNKFLNENDIMNINDLPFKDEIKQMGGKIYSVGGAVRDKYLGKDSKDLDILITGIPLDKLENVLIKYGKVNMVGKSFGIIKFIPKGHTEDIDIAIPRTEIPNNNNNNGHKNFDVTSDHTLPIEKDLERRDFTINAIANSIDGEVIDTYNGRDDIKNKIIRVVNPKAFSDDPLRMLRAVQFAARFGFEIENNTMNLIKSNSSNIKNISSERILTEFEKIVTKGDKLIGAKLLVETKLYENIFDNKISIEEISKLPFNNVNNLAEFLYLLMFNIKDKDIFYLKKFSTLDSKKDRIFKNIKSLSYSYDENSNNIYVCRLVAFKMYNTYEESIYSKIISLNIQKACNELINGNYPKKITDINISGNDLLNVGISNVEIGNVLKKILGLIFYDKLKNNKEEILNYIKNNNNTINELDNNKNKISYSAVVLTESSKNDLIKLFNKMIPEGWKIIAHHMTINLGEINNEYVNDLGKKVDLYVTGYGIDENVLAARVSGFNSMNKIPHITIAINSNNNAKPVMSNYIKNWNDINFTFKLEGIVTEVPFNNINENDNKSNDDQYGCLMGFIDIPKWNNLKKLINDDDYYIDDSHDGFSDEPHVTILYGFNYGIKPNEIFEFYKNNFNNEKIPIEISSKLSLFENELFDVLKFEIKSDKLYEINKEFNKFPNTQTYKDYNPHITVAYLKKGKASKYINNEDNDKTYKYIVDKLVFSYYDNDSKYKDNFNLNENYDDKIINGYNKVVKSIKNSRVIDDKLKDEIIKLVTSISRYKIGGHVFELSKPQDLSSKSNKINGVSLGADKKGFYVYTHRARSKSHLDYNDITVKEIEFIESTG